MYKVTFTGQFLRILQVPPIITEINERDAFVLDYDSYHSEVFLYKKMIYFNDDLKQFNIGRNLAMFISTDEKQFKEIDRRRNKSFISALKEHSTEVTTTKNLYTEQQSVTIVQNQNLPLAFTINFTDVMELFLEDEIDNETIKNTIKGKFTFDSTST